MCMRCMSSGVCLLIVMSVANAGDWAQWRGPNHNNVAVDGQTVPAEWSESRNIVWKASVPGRGHASPTVVGNVILSEHCDRCDADAECGRL
jgi:outer membrane protein assembly factor BamB